MILFHLSQTLFFIWNINAKGSWGLFEAIRHKGKNYCPRVVFTSSIAVFGAPFPDQIPDNFFTTPLTSYGAQKAISELLLADYSRKGMIDGISIRLPTICVRPGKPNLAASGFFLRYYKRTFKWERSYFTSKYRCKTLACYTPISCRLFSSCS
jgi:nucleoside-diphosphate-sugar epimerase